MKTKGTTIILEAKAVGENLSISTAYDPGLTEKVRDVDLLFHEATFSSSALIVGLAIRV